MHEETGLALREERPVSLLTGNPSERVAQATEIAHALAPVVECQHLYINISGKRHVLYEGWTTLGALVGVFPITVWSRPTEHGWEARVEARTLNGAIIGAAEAECSRAEKRWATADDYAIRSMAQTRAGSKALRMPLGFIMQLGGFEPTPAEEMPEEKQETKGTRRKPLAETAQEIIAAGPAPACECGKPRIYRAGTNAKGVPYRGWFCPTNRHKVQWIPTAQAVKETDKAQADLSEAEWTDDPDAPPHDDDSRGDPLQLRPEERRML